MSIHRRQYTECFLAALLPSLLLGWQVCWGLAALPLFTYYILYWAERLAVGHLAFDYEAEKESEEVSYFVVRKRFAWWKWYWKKELPAIDRDWLC
ncbi:hypothetical protein [Parabacteroides massiliensis]|uniref:hypothetical protein n=1 Tax=Parabacteroides massiliensis TaxID=1750560 RepID=UPI001FC9EF24|nr:hypothetical protein [Parabacteroides massiliensis]